MKWGKQTRLGYAQYTFDEKITGAHRKSNSDMEELKVIASLDKDNNSEWIVQVSTGQRMQKILKMRKKLETRKVREEIDYVVDQEKQSGSEARWKPVVSVNKMRRRKERER
jgi:F0F1-type ATP synthase alpha subunit